MKIAFVLSQSLDSPSGLGRHGPLARQLARLGHSVEIFALHHAWSQLPRKGLVEDGVRVVYAGQMHVRKEGPRKQYFSPGRLLLISMTSTLRLAQVLSRSNADTVQLCKPQPINTLAVRLGARSRPVYCDCDDYEAETNRFGGAWQRSIVRHFEDGIVGHAAGLTTNTRFMFDHYLGLGFPENQMAYVPNGVERGRFAVQPNVVALRQRWGLLASDPLVVYIGTLSTLSHSVDLLLAAFARVVHRVPSAHLLLVGGGEDYDALHSQAKALGLMDRAIFTGRVAPSEVPGYLAMATVSVDPVKDDLVARARSPLKIVESLAAAVPIVTGDVGDRRDMLSGGELGVLVHPGDIDALAEGILSLLLEPASRDRMHRAALDVRERWFWDHLVSDFARVYGTARADER